MSFFAEIPEPDLTQDVREIRKIPAWVQPSNNELPVAIPLTRILARNPGYALSLLRADVFSSGVMFKLRLDMRYRAAATPAQRDDMHRTLELYGMGRGADADRVRLGLALPGGVTVDSGLQIGYPSWDKEPGSPVLSIRGGGGGGDEMGSTTSIDAWLWPLPEAGVATMHFACAGLGLAEGSTEIDTRVLLDAVEGVLKLEI